MVYERNTVTSNGSFNHAAIIRVAVARTRQELEGDQKLREYGVVSRGHVIVPADPQMPVRPWRKVFATELKSAWAIARSLRDSHLAAKEQATWTPRARLIGTLQLRLEKLKHGLGMPYDARAVDHYESLLAQARASADRDPGVLLASQLQAAE